MYKIKKKYIGNIVHVRRRGEITIVDDPQFYTLYRSLGLEHIFYKSRAKKKTSKMKFPKNEPKD